MGKYWTVFLLSFRQALKLKKSWLFSSLLLLGTSFLFAQIWKAATQTPPLSPQYETKLLWYIVWNEWLLLSLPSLHEEIGEDLGKRELLSLLTRPVSYLGITLVRGLGTFASHLIATGVLVFPTLWLLGFSFPSSPLGCLLLLSCTLIAGSLLLLIQMILGFSSLWIGEAFLLYWLFEKLLFLWGGLFLPLAAYPPLLQTIAKFLPFSPLLGERSALALSATPSQISALLLSYLGWGSCLLGLLFALYFKMLACLGRSR